MGRGKRRTDGGDMSEEKGVLCALAICDEVLRNREDFGEKRQNHGDLMFVDKNIVMPRVESRLRRIEVLNQAHLSRRPGERVASWRKLDSSVRTLFLKKRLL